MKLKCLAPKNAVVGSWCQVAGVLHELSGLFVVWIVKCWLDSWLGWGIIQKNEDDPSQQGFLFEVFSKKQK